MGRRTTDLFDVFNRPTGNGGRKPNRRSRSGKPKAGKPKAGKPQAGSKAAGSKRPFEGVFLNPRQTLLAGCVLALLLVLSFTVGLGFGRRGGDETDALSLSREETTETAPWYVVGRISRVDPHTGAPVRPEELLADLERLHDLPAANLQVRPVRGDEARLDVFLGEFPSKEAADAYYAQHEGYLAGIRVQNVYPFGFAISRQLESR